MCWAQQPPGHEHLFAIAAGLHLYGCWHFTHGQVAPPHVRWGQALSAPQYSVPPPPLITTLVHAASSLQLMAQVAALQVIVPH